MSVGDSKDGEGSGRADPDEYKPPRVWHDSNAHFRAAIEAPWYRLLFELYGHIHLTTTNFFSRKGFRPALLPVTTQSISSPMGLGSDSRPVDVVLFGERTYLADSMQFQLEYLLRHCDAGVFYIMPTFRGEDPDSRHLNQFFHAEAELRGSLENVILLIEEYLASLASDLLSNCTDGLTRASGTDLVHMRQLIQRAGSLPRISYSEARSILRPEAGHFVRLQNGVDSISSSGEVELMRRFGGMVWLTHPPASTVPFYQARSADGVSAMSADLLMGIGETVGAGERHVDNQAVLQSLADHGVHASEYEWYLRMKEQYPLRTSGFGLGIERFLLWALAHDDIRDMHLISRLKGCTSLP